MKKIIRDEFAHSADRPPKCRGANRSTAIIDDRDSLPVGKRSLALSFMNIVRHKSGFIQEFGKLIILKLANCFSRSAS